MGRWLAVVIAVLIGMPGEGPPAMGATLLQAEPLSSENAPADPILDQTDSQSAPAPTDATASIVLATIAVGCTVWIVRRRLFDPLGASRTVEAPFGRIADWPMLLLGGMVVWVAQSAGASSAVTLFSLASDDVRTLRGGALVSLGGYVAAFIGVAFTLAVLPDMAGRIRVYKPGRDTLRGAMHGLAAFLLVFPIVMTIGWAASLVAQWVTGESPESVAHDTLRLLSDRQAARAEGAGWWWITVGGVLIGAPIVEEIVYRGFIQGAIRRAVLWSAAARGEELRRVPPRRRAAWTGIIGTSLIFASMHAGVVETHALFTLLALSIGLGIACERSGRLIAPIVMHVLFNAVNLGFSLAL